MLSVASLACHRPNNLAPAPSPIRPNDLFYDVAFSDDARGWIVGSGGCILRTTDGGDTWTRTVVDGMPALFSVAAADARTVWIAGSDGTVLRTDDGGETWARVAVPTTNHLFAIDRFGWVVGDRGTMLVTTDGGATWTDRSLGEETILNDVAFADAKRGLVVGEYGAIFTTGDGGATWKRTDTGTTLFGCGWAGDDAIAVGLDGQILRNGEPVASPTKNALFAVEGGWIVGNRGTVLELKDGAWTLREDRPGRFAALRGLGGSWAVGGQGTAVRLRTACTERAAAGGESK